MSFSGLLLARKGVRMVLEPPTRFIQRVQAMFQKQLIRCALEDKEFTLPWPARLAGKIPFLRSMLAKTIGMGPRPEFVED